MNILHVTQSYYPSIGGTQHTMKKVAEYLHHIHGDTVSVYTTNSLTGPNRPGSERIPVAEEYINAVFVKRFNYLRIHQPVIKSLSKVSNLLLKRSLPFYFADLYGGPVSLSMKRALMNTNADVICASSIHYLFADYGRWRKFSKHPKPFILYGALHLSNNLKMSAKYLERIRLADQYIANTAFERDYLIQQGTPENKIHITGAATDVLNYDTEVTDTATIRTNLGLKQDDKVIVYIGRQESFKGIPLLLKSFHQLVQAHVNYKLIIAGAAGTFSETLKNIARTDNNIIVLTGISDEDKCKILRVANVLVLPSKEESFGVVFLEAWSFKKPVIGANIGAVASLIDNNKDGYLFEPDNAASLSKCIENILDNETKGIEMGEAGYHKVQEFYTWEKVATRFRLVYEMAIESFNKNSLLSD